MAVALAVERALCDERGDVLVFLPGIGEITRVRERLVASLPVHVEATGDYIVAGIEPATVTVRIR